MVKALLHKIIICVTLLLVGGSGKILANGCTGSWFQIQYSPWCDCWQVCGNYISDCDEIVSLDWNFGDGTTATGESPCHHFAQPGTYTITMTIVAYCHNSFFNIFTTTCHITQTITVTNTQNMLTANFAADTSCLGVGTQFTNLSVAPSGTSTYTWDFGDGTTGSGENPTHTFDSCGAYDVTMIVTNTTPCCNIPGHDTIVRRVYVNCAPFDEANNLGDGDPYIQESAASVSTTAGTCAGDTTHFLLTPNGPVTTWQWVFPDSSTSTSATPTYVYNACPPAVNYTYVNLFTNHGCRGILDSITGIFCPSDIATSSTTTLCSNQCSGTATVTMTGNGTPPFTIVWSDPQGQTNFTATTLCAGNYTATVTDGNGCTAVSPSVNVPDFPFPFTGSSLVQGMASCWNGGSALLMMTGGTTPYTYLWSTGQTTDSAQNLPGGTVTVTATDAHGCVFTLPIVIPVNPPIQANITPVDAGCGLCNGSATAVASGGSGAPYYYDWLTTPGQSNPTATNLCQGLYQLVVHDGVYCADTFATTINENGSQPVTASATSAMCSNICNGTATANLTGGCGIAPCTFVWLDSAGTPIGQTTATATNLCAGTYSVRVTNGNGCNSFATTTVTIPNPVLASATPAPNTCGGNCNGSISASASGGSPGYSYAWYDAANNVIAGQSGAAINNVCAGNYTVRVTDAQGCTVSAAALVLSNPLQATATTTAIRCNSDCNGIITTAVIGGTTPYTFVVRDAANNIVYTGASQVIGNLCAGSYTLTVGDAGNCTVNIPVTITEPAALNPMPSFVEPTCFGNCNGSVSVTVNGGTPPYRFSWINSGGNPLAGGTLPTVNNLCAGGYAVQVTDTNSCVTPYLPVTLNQPAPLDDTLAVIDPYCSGGLGTIDMTVTGGTGPFTYNWNNGTYNTEDISGLNSGTYTVLVTDAHNCTTRDTVVFQATPLLSAYIFAYTHNGYQFKCNGGDDGEIVVRVTGGVPPYTYQWNDSLNSTVDSIYGLSAGVYTVTVQDANGCVWIDSIPLTNEPPPFSITTNPQNVSCAGATDGSITVTPAGGVAPYIYYWNSDTSLLNAPLTGLDSGQYIVHVFDSVFCLLTDTILITEPAPMVLSHTWVDVLCHGDSSGSIDLSVTGGGAPYAYSWNNGAYSTEDISGGAAGQYIVNVTDSSNCTRADTVIINEPAAISASAAAGNVSCYQGSDGTVTLTVTGGTLPYGFNWNSGAYTTQNLQGVPAGSYDVVVTDSNACTATATANVSQPALITGNRQVSICITDSFYAGGAYQTAPGIYYDTLTTAAGCDSVLATDLSFITQFNTQLQQTLCYGQGLVFNGQYYGTSGIYTDTLTASGGCDSIVTLTLNVLPDIGLYAVPDQATLLVGDSITINVYTAANANPVSYTWTPANGLSCTNCSTTVASPLFDMHYVVVAIDSSNNCRDTVLIPVNVEGGVIYVPNAFTPNNDGVNDVFKVYGRGFARFKMMVFNRWGEKVYESTDPNAGWDGTFKGAKLNPDVFVYVIDVDFVDGNTPEEYYQMKKGSVTLIR